MANILKDNSYMALPSSIKRGNPAPLDITEIWFNYEDMETYAQTNPSAYVGQQIALVDEINNTATAYIILNAAGDLQEIGSGVLTDNLSIVIDDNSAIGLYNYGKQYYKYDASRNSYVLQIVDEEHPWIRGLEPKVVFENEQLVLGWYEPRVDINNFIDQIGRPGTDESDASGIYAELENKANADEVYTIEETNLAITTAIANVDHMRRKIVEDINEINQYIETKGAEALSYIFMIANADSSDESNKYTEYIVLQNENDSYSVEAIGDWEVDLTNYVRREDLVAHYVTKDTLNDTLNDYVKNDALNEYAKTVDIYTGTQIDSIINSLEENSISPLEQLLNQEVERSKKQDEEFDSSLKSIAEHLNQLTSGEIIKSVDTKEFAISDTKELQLLSVPASKIQGLNEHSAFTNLQADINNVSTSVQSLSSYLNNYLLKSELNTELAPIQEQVNTLVDAMTWKTLQQEESN